MLLTYSNSKLVIHWLTLRLIVQKQNIHITKGRCYIPYGEWPFLLLLRPTRPNCQWFHSPVHKLMLALLPCSRTLWHMGKQDRKQVYDLPIRGDWSTSVPHAPLFTLLQISPLLICIFVIQTRGHVHRCAPPFLQTASTNQSAWNKREDRILNCISTLCLKACTFQQSMTRILDMTLSVSCEHSRSYSHVCTKDTETWLCFGSSM